MMDANLDRTIESNPPWRMMKLRMPARVALAAVTVIALAACSADGSGDSTESPSASVSGSDSTAEGELTSEVARLIQEGIDQAQSGDLRDAAVTFNNALVLDPGNKYALYNLGLVAQTRGKEADALAYYEQALESDPQYTPAMFNKAILLEADDLDQAIEIYRQILEIDDQASTTYLRLSWAYQQQGEDDLADEMAAKAVELDPSLASQTKAP